MIMNTAHTLYRLLCNNQRLLERLAGVVTSYPQVEAERLLQKFFLRRHLLEPEPLDYTRLFAFLRKNFQGVDLHGEDFSDMHLEGFNFAEAQLQGAQLSRSNLNHANLIRNILTS